MFFGSIKAIIHAFIPPIYKTNTRKLATEITITIQTNDCNRMTTPTQTRQATPTPTQTTPTQTTPTQTTPTQTPLISPIEKPHFIQDILDTH
jgi:hypothetical protein